MPRVVKVSIETPMSVEEAARVFGSTVRLHLIRYYRANPRGPQKGAAEYLGIARTVVHDHTKILVAAGVLDQAEGSDKRAPEFSVNEDRLRELKASLDAFSFGS